MPIGRLGIAALFITICACRPPCASAGYNHEPWSGNEPYPQYANIAPLPGGGAALDRNGLPDGLGAFQVNIPVAYTPGWGYFNLSAYAGDYSNGKSEPFGNGSFVLGMGFGRSRRIYMSGLQVSRHWDESKAVNGQLMVAGEGTRAPAISVGIQDILYKEPSGHSPYAVATKEFSAGSKPIYATLGYGSGRFLDRFFGGVSIPLAPSLGVAAEWDGFQLNSGVAWRPGGRRGNLTILTAYNGKAGWLAGAGIALSLGSP